MPASFSLAFTASLIQSVVQGGARDVSIKDVGTKQVMMMGVEPINKLPILQALDSAGHKIKNFNIDEPNLEDAFMKLTGEDR